MDEFLRAVVSDEDDQLQKPTVRVESEAQLAAGVLVIERNAEYCPGCGFDRVVFGNAMLER
ncbi:hypothetical protein [Microbacterium sp. USHLN272]|uniref:hypothetical protein n=1 Tax=Microbacterium sp. USHLN272 TaxID=3081287 RepID=UPI00301A5D58